jgi:hypothetical protein
MIYNDNASKYHRAMGDLLEQLKLTGLGVYQEQNVKEICPSHPNPLDRFDFYIPALSLVIEVHGEQHYNAATFGGISKQKASFNFAKGSIRDVEKANTAKVSGLTYISFSYKEKFTEELFFYKYKEAVSLSDRPKELNIPTELSYAQSIYQEQKKKGMTGFKKGQGFIKKNKE